MTSKQIDKACIDKARDKLRLASKAAQDIAAVDSFETLKDAWYVLLVAGKNIYATLEQGAKVTPQIKQWWLNRKQDQKNDELLQYLSKARDADEHGLAETTGMVNGTIKPRYVPLDDPRGVTEMDLGPFGHLTAPEGKRFIVEFRGKHPLLMPVETRGVKYFAPSVHKGQKLPDREPSTVANAAVLYWGDLIDEAERQRST